MHFKIKTIKWIGMFGQGGETNSPTQRLLGHMSFVRVTRDWRPCLLAAKAASFALVGAATGAFVGFFLSFLYTIIKLSTQDYQQSDRHRGPLLYLRLLIGLCSGAGAIIAGLIAYSKMRVAPTQAPIVGITVEDFTGQAVLGTAPQHINNDRDNEAPTVVIRP